QFSPSKPPHSLAEPLRAAGAVRTEPAVRTPHAEAATLTPAPSAAPTAASSPTTIHHHPEQQPPLPRERRRHASGSAMPGMSGTPSEHHPGHQQQGMAGDTSESQSAFGVSSYSQERERVVDRSAEQQLPYQFHASQAFGGTGSAPLAASSEYAYEYPYPSYGHYNFASTQAHVHPQQQQQHPLQQRQQQGYPSSGSLGVLATSSAAAEHANAISRTESVQPKYHPFQDQPGYGDNTPMPFTSPPHTTERPDAFIQLRYSHDSNQIDLSSVHHQNPQQSGHGDATGYRAVTSTMSSPYAQPYYTQAAQRSFEAPAATFRPPVTMRTPQQMQPNLQRSTYRQPASTAHASFDSSALTKHEPLLVAPTGSVAPEDVYGASRSAPVYSDAVYAGHVQMETAVGSVPVSNDESCRLCFTSAGDRVSDTCGHRFHQTCLAQCLQQQECPACGQLVNAFHPVDTVHSATTLNYGAMVGLSHHEPMQASTIGSMSMPSAKPTRMPDVQAHHRPPSIDTRHPEIPLSSPTAVSSSRPSSATSSNGSSRTKKLKKLKDCSVVGCDRTVRSRGLCKGHGGGRRCGYPGCGLSDQGGGFCISHGGGKRCQREGCENSAQSRGLCKLHGGGSRCTVANCTKSSQGKGLCRAHGGGRRCIVEGCNKTDRRAGYCVTHGADKKCIVPECSKTGRIDNLCTKHYFERNQPFDAATGETKSSDLPTNPEDTQGERKKKGNDTFGQAGSGHASATEAFMFTNPADQQSPMSNTNPTSVLTAFLPVRNDDDSIDI
ncbi:TPA: hypothetical protein N0F65_003771, partial [Lagenidium giganteum]